MGATMNKIRPILAAFAVSAAVIAGPAAAQTVIIQQEPQPLPAPLPAPAPVIVQEQVPELRRVFVDDGFSPVPVDFDVVTGARVPETIELRPVPPQLVEVVPQYEGYRYVAVEGGRYAIVEPSTSEVVYVVE